MLTPFNRSGLFLMAYLLFPVNVLLGVVLGVWRIVITGLFNIVHLCRMDISLLSRGMEAFDPGGWGHGWPSKWIPTVVIATAFSHCQSLRHQHSVTRPPPDKEVSSTALYLLEMQHHAYQPDVNLITATHFFFFFFLLYCLHQIMQIPSHEITVLK